MPDKFKENSRALKFFQEHQAKIYQSTDRLFAVLLPIQWLLAIILALFLTPLSWNGTANGTHPHVWTAFIVGGVITSLPLFLAIRFTGATFTRYSIAVSQILMSSLLIHITGGRIETHFHIFGSLAFLAFYRDWRVLIPATIVTTADHIFRGWFYPQEIYGVLTNVEWRWLEHAAWVVFEDIFLIILCHRSVKEMWESAVHITALNDSETRYRAVVEQIGGAQGIFASGVRLGKVHALDEEARRDEGEGVEREDGGASEIGGEDASYGCAEREVHGPGGTGKRIGDSRFLAAGDVGNHRRAGRLKQRPHEGFSEQQSVQHRDGLEEIGEQHQPDDAGAHPVGEHHDTPAAHVIVDDACNRRCQSHRQYLQHEGERHHLGRTGGFDQKAEDGDGIEPVA